jgi:6-phosphogluconolactonase
MGTAAKYNTNIEITPDAESFALRGVQIFIRNAERAIQERGKFCVAISGGQTPVNFFRLLGDLAQSRSLAWDKIHLFWVDERMVETDLRFSNYKIAADTFLPKVDIPKENIHRIPTEYSDLREAAFSYEKTIRDVFRLEQEQIPCFDLIVLGLSVEGCPGSLFPNCFAAFDEDSLACVVYDLEERLSRITLSRAVLRAASHLVILVSGHQKAGILRDVFTSEPDEVRYPIHFLWPVLDKVTWLLDREAAVHIKD